ncbi:MAG TPA: hypothetical protein VF727_11705 [Allosphingosinicella sp.]|jgi:hypothetical protein
MRYYFHLREGDGYVADEEGLDLPGPEAALAAARRGARSLIASEALLGKLPLAAAIEVEDEHGVILFDLPFRDAVVMDG